MINPNKNVPRAMFASAAVASIYFIVLPVVWLGVLGPEQLSKDLMLVLGPTFAPVFGSFAKAAAIWFMMFNMFHGTLQPLAGAARASSPLAEAGLLPRTLIVAGLVAAVIWIISAVLGFQQFGMTTVLVGVLFAYSGSVLYAWRRFRDRRSQGLPGVANTLHIKLTGAMLLVLALDGAG